MKIYIEHKYVIEAIKDDIECNQGNKDMQWGKRQAYQQTLEYIRIYFK